jgi:hypothetical protein
VGPLLSIFYIFPILVSSFYLKTMCVRSINCDLLSLRFSTFNSMHVYIYYDVSKFPCY